VRIKRHHAGTAKIRSVRGAKARTEQERDHPRAPDADGVARHVGGRGGDDAYPGMSHQFKPSS
jgi:hypothetical protein